MFAPTENFIDAIRGRAPNGSPAANGVFATRIIEAAVQSVRTGRNIVLREMRQDRRQVWSAARATGIVPAGVSSVRDQRLAQ